MSAADATERCPGSGQSTPTAFAVVGESHVRGRCARCGERILLVWGPDPGGFLPLVAVLAEHNRDRVETARDAGEPAP